MAVFSSPIIFGNRTDVGMVRTENQDYFSYRQTRHGQLFVLADGMGGEAGGATASQTAVQSFIESVEAAPDQDPREVLLTALQFANQRVLDKAAADPSLKGMGTTLEAVLIKAGLVYWIHIGDSRIYLYRPTGFVQVTRDQTLVQKMLDSKMLTAEEAKVFPNRHVLSEVIGRDDSPNPQLCPAPEPLREGDTYLLCSDGLTDLVNEQEMVQTMVAVKFDPQQVADRLVEMANQRGGHDNTTVQVIRKGLPGAALSKSTVIIPSKPAANTQIKSWHLMAAIGAMVVVLSALTTVLVMKALGNDNEVKLPSGQTVPPVQTPPPIKTIPVATPPVQDQERPLPPPVEPIPSDPQQYRQEYQAPQIEPDRVIRKPKPKPKSVSKPAIKPSPQPVAGPAATSKPAGPVPGATPTEKPKPTAGQNPSTSAPTPAPTPEQAPPPAPAPATQPASNTGPNSPGGGTNTVANPPPEAPQGRGLLDRLKIKKNNP